jgi:SpoIID/LytB domain protein
MSARLAAAALCVLLVLQPQADAAPNRDRFGSVRAPVRLVPTDSQPTDIGGLNSFFGEIRLNAAADGIVIVNRLSLERYLLGLQEVPVRWPDEALRAQAVAARTYALYTLDRPPAGAAATYGFDICASVECQVFAGADVVGGSDGERWLRAVRGTAGRTILFRGEPILARYHSTSGGRTFDNEQIFTDESSYPYLQGVESTSEESSPLYRWTVYFRLDRLQSMLRAAGMWPRGKGRLVEVRTIRSRAGLHYPDVVLRGKRGRSVVDAEELRTLLRDLAPRFYPDLYPSPWTTSSGFLPETLPSNRVEIRTNEETAIVRGRGWGHGVGMSQWGAYGMAREGASYGEILEHYYTGVEIGERTTDDPVDVGVDWSRLEVAATGGFALVDGRGRTLEEDALGTWGFAWLGPGRLAIEPPDGVGRALRVGIVKAPQSIQAGDAVRIAIDLSRPARVSTLTDGAADPGAEVRNSGPSEISWNAPDEPGRYEVQIAAAVGSAERRSDPVTLVVSAPAERGSESGEEERSASGDRSSLPWFLLVGLVAIILVVALRLGRIRG